MTKVPPSIFFLFLLVLIPLPSYAETEDVTGNGNFTINAETTEPEHQSEIQAGISSIFDAIGEFGKAQTDSTDWVDQEKKDQINEVNDSGVHTGKTAFGLWWAFHEFVVNAIFAGSPIPFDQGIAVLISFVLSAVLVFLLFKDFIKKTWKIGAVIVAVIAVILILGIQAPSI